MLKYTQKEGVRENPRKVEDRSSSYFLFKVITRETGEGWLLLRVETEVNGDQRGQMKGVLPWLVPWACRGSTKDFCSALAALVGPVENIFFLTVHYFNYFFPIAQQAGQAAMLGRLSLSVRLWG